MGGERERERERERIFAWRKTTGLAQSKTLALFGNDASWTPLGWSSRITRGRAAPGRWKGKGSQAQPNPKTNSCPHTPSRSSHSCFLVSEVRNLHVPSPEHALERTP